MNATELYDLTITERRRLAALLADLTPQQWATDSLCDGWRVREVVAHLNRLTQSWDAFSAAVAAAGGDMNLVNDQAARADGARLSDGELLETYRLGIPSRWTPGPDAHQDALAHEVMHGLDITVPLGLPGPAPEVVAAAVSGFGADSLAFFGVDLGTTRLVADDADLAVAAVPDGEEVTEVRLPASELTLVVTGRAPLPRPTDQSGPLR